MIVELDLETIIRRHTDIHKLFAGAQVTVFTQNDFKKQEKASTVTLSILTTSCAVYNDTSNSAVTLL